MYRGTIPQRLQEICRTGFVVTNTNTEKVAVNVEKKCEGGAGDSAVVNLLADGKKVDSKTLTAKENWKHAFEDLDKYDKNDGHQIAYTIQEEELSGYKAKIQGDEKEGFVITNTKETTPDKPNEPTDPKTPKKPSTTTKTKIPTASAAPSKGTGASSSGGTSTVSKTVKKTGDPTNYGVLAGLGLLALAALAVAIRIKKNSL